MPALNTSENMAAFCQKTRRIAEAVELYSRTLLGVEVVFGSTNAMYDRIASVLTALRSCDDHSIVDELSQLIILFHCCD